jgi:zinc D-Ala-D-Ala dipeptidase
MQIWLKAKLGYMPGIQLESYELEHGSELAFGTSATYSESLLRLFAKYKAFAAEPPDGDAGAAIRDDLFRLEFDKKLQTLFTNSKKSDHPCHRLIHNPLDRPEGARSKNPALFEVLGAKKGIRFTPGLIAAKDVIIILDDNPLPLDDPENVEVFLRCLEMCRPETDGIFDSGGIRENLRYTITFRDTPTNDKQGRFRPNSYRYFDADLSFTRLTLAGCDHFTVNLVQADAEEVSKYRPAQSSNLVYREVFSVEKRDAKALSELLEGVMQASPAESDRKLSEVFQIEAKVNQETVKVTSVTPLESEYCLRYDLPDGLRRKLKLDFHIRLSGFRARAQSAYPIEISEVTKGASLSFNCSQTDIARIGYFLGAESRVRPGHPDVKAGTDKNSKGFWWTSPPTHYLFPGEGAVVHWLHVERVEHVELVDVGRGNWGISVDPPPESASHPGNGPMGAPVSACVVKSTAQKLRAVADALRLPPFGFALKLLEGYRPSSVVSHPAGSSSTICSGHASGHNRGCAVDVTVVGADGSEVPMPTMYREATVDARRSVVESGEPQEKLGNYQILKTEMLAAGFEAPVDGEWWHFVDEDWRKHPILTIDDYARAVRQPGALEAAPKEVGRVPDGQPAVPRSRSRTKRPTD